MQRSITIQVNGKNFSAALEDNPSARAFAERLPLEVNMTEYKDLATSYTYTRPGKLNAPADLEKILGAGTVRVTFKE